MFYVVTGGSGSGKSEYAEKILADTDSFPRIYLATMMVWDEEGKRRVERHRLMRRGKGFETVELYHTLEQFELRKPENNQPEAAHPAPGYGQAPARPATGSGQAAAAKKPSVLLECMSNLVSNEYYRLGAESAAAVIRGIKHLQIQCENLIIVTNEVFSGGRDYGPETLEYMELLGAVNRYLGEAAGSVTEVVYGIPIKIK